MSGHRRGSQLEALSCSATLAAPHIHLGPLEPQLLPPLSSLTSSPHLPWPAATPGPSPRRVETPDPASSRKAAVTLAGLTLTRYFMCGAGPWAPACSPWTLLFLSSSHKLASRFSQTQEQKPDPCAASAAARSGGPKKAGSADMICCFYLALCPLPRALGSFVSFNPDKTPLGQDPARRCVFTFLART